MKISEPTPRSSRLYPEFRPHRYSRINQEITTDQLDTSDIRTADPAEEIEATRKAVSGMSFVVAPVQNTASAVSSTDNPIALIDWISSFVKTLEEFNGVVDHIATVSTTLYPANPYRIPIGCLLRFILTSKQHGLSSLLLPRSGQCASLVTQSNLRIADNY